VPILFTPTDFPVTAPQVDEGPRLEADWVSPDGTVLRLTDCAGGIDWMRGREGTDLPPFELVEDEVIGGEGSVIRGVRVLPRLVSVPIIMHSGTWARWRALQQTIAQALNPVAGDGRLVFRHPDGTVRVLPARYVGGAEGTDLHDPAGLHYRLYPLKLRAVAPYALDADPIRLEWRSGASTGGFFPLHPVRLASSRVLGETNARNTGHVQTSGVWTIHGPADGTAVLRHDGLGRELVLDLSGAEALSEGDSRVVDMRPGLQSIRDQNGQSRWRVRVGTPQMWPLLPGDNPLTLQVGGAETGTRVTFEYTRRWLTL
jgi:hypothetical protein